MEQQTTIKDHIIHIFKNGKREIIGDFQGRINEISGSLLKSIQIGSIEYKGFNFIEGEVFPSPKKGDIIRFHEIKISQKLEDNFNFKIIISEFSEPTNIIIAGQTEIKESLDFSKKNILKELKNLLKLEGDFQSDLFCVKAIQEKSNLLVLKCLSPKKSERNYKIDKKYLDNISMKENDEINWNHLTKIEKLEGDNLFKYLDNNEILENCFYGKIIEIVNSKFISIFFIDKENQLKKLTTNINLNNYPFELFKICFITDCEINEENVIINEDSRLYLSSQDIYFDQLNINNNSVIEFFFPDFNEKFNFYDIIEIKLQKLKIKGPILYFVIHTYYSNYLDFFPIKITLISTKYKIIKEFQFILVHGILNKINCFVNFSDNNSFFYEFYYYSFISYNLPSSMYIEIKNKKYCLNRFDSLDCSKRRRFNILNVPKNNKYSEYKLNESNSFQICQINKINNESFDFGIFDIKKIECSYFVENLYFDKYFDTFGGVLDYVLNYKDKHYQKLINYCKNILESEPTIIQNKNFVLSMLSFETKLTLRQFKTRIGIILCFYLIEYHPSLFLPFFTEFKELYEKSKRYNLNLWDTLNILYFFTKESLSKSYFHVIFIDELKENSPYKLAFDNNIKEIEYLTETSCLFFCYLQIDSFILTNYLQKNKKSFLFSMENLFILKKHLLQQNKKYFVITLAQDNYLAKYDEKFRMTIINENLLFPEFKFNTIKENIDENSKDLAVPISSGFRHENNGHSKKNSKNQDKDSPELICKKEGPQEIHDLSLSNIGESGRFIESFIGDQNEIYDIDFSRHLGETLNFKYYIQEDFKELKKKIKDLEHLKLLKPPVKKLSLSRIPKNLRKKGLNEENKEKNNFKYNKRKYSRCYCGDPFELELHLKYLHEKFPTDI